MTIKYFINQEIFPRYVVLFYDNNKEGRETFKYISDIIENNEFNFRMHHTTTNNTTFNIATYGEIFPGDSFFNIFAGILNGRDYKEVDVFEKEDLCIQHFNEINKELEEVESTSIKTLINKLLGRSDSKPLK